MSEPPASRVLVVEDDEAIAQGLVFNLERKGYRVDASADGAEALERIRGTRYDLIAMDLSLPALNGIEAARRIRAMPGRRRTPIVAVTANVLPMTRQECLQAGITEFVYKPYTAGGLLLTVLKCLDQVRV